MARSTRSRTRLATGLLRWGLLGGALALGAWGCALFVGVDFDAVHLAPEAGPLDTDQGEAGADDAPPGSRCAANEKLCDGTCVSTALPTYGCGAASCEPCSLDLAKGSKCVNGSCAPSECQTGFEDCDGNPANGCEADLSRPQNCGACGVQCGPGTLCAPTGCVSVCPPPLVPCGGSCVDTKASLAHCGGCDAPCPAAANADPLCADGKCGITCRPGFADCTRTPAKACTALPKWYADGDGDGFGTAVFVSGCTRPAGHAPVSGDCLDTNAAVFPDAGASDLPFDASTGPSFDYDCSGAENEEGALPHFISCSPCNATRDGYLPVTPARAGTGVNDFCGSRTKRRCLQVLSTCATPTTTDNPPIRCR